MAEVAPRGHAKQQSRDLLCRCDLLKLPCHRRGDRVHGAPAGDRRAHSVFRHPRLLHRPLPRGAAAAPVHAALRLLPLGRLDVEPPRRRDRRVLPASDGDRRHLADARRGGGGRPGLEQRQDCPHVADRSPRPHPAHPAHHPLRQRLADLGLLDRLDFAVLGLGVHPAVNDHVCLWHRVHAERHRPHCRGPRPRPALEALLGHPDGIDIHAVQVNHRRCELARRRHALG
mmetsp:Transcript_65247/g.180986  ORF Transcript_65247/g.180986 Transcript_65247/m.180986 type:complete len:229 (-) Transcript_65247:455-1141(-)